MDTLVDEYLTQLLWIFTNIFAPIDTGNGNNNKDVRRHKREKKINETGFQRLWLRNVTFHP